MSNRRRRKIELPRVPTLIAAVSVGLLLAGGTVHFQARGQESPEGEASRQGPSWNEIETTGEEGELVELVFEDEWVIVGERGMGVRVYDSPPYQVPIRKWEDIPMYPCSDCHNKMEIDYTRRKLVKDHADLVVDHGHDRFWCTDCHDGKGLDSLVSKGGQPIDMDLGYLQCGECHFGELKDWEYGIHGKRIGLWNGVRVLRTCTECHNAHRPAIAAETPVPPPTVRSNLAEFSQPAADRPKVWEQIESARETNP